MKIKFRRYLLATKETPLEFDSREEDGEFTDNIEEAYLYDNEQVVKGAIEEFDDTVLYQALPVIITYEI